jgi:glutamate--cysteine ligase
MSETPPLRRDQLIESYARYGAPEARWLVGVEFERAVVRPDGAPIAYDDDDGIRWILQQLAAGDPGWAPYEESGHLIALLRKNGASITLEPGGQVELSGAPHRALADLAAEVRENRDRLLALSAGKAHRWIAAGLTPYAPIESVHWMPKGRYRVMREYLPQYGDLAHAMMKGTCSVQANFDYADEADCADKVRLCAGIAPLTTAIFSNSPLLAGQDTGFLSYRGHIWTRTDPARTGFPPGLRDDYSHERWVDYLLDVPMMFYKKGSDWAPAHGATFRTFMDQGIDGQRAGWSDWELHQTSVFPEVRVKRTIEVRGADCVDIDLSIAFCAFFTGLLYDRAALDQGIALAAALGAAGTREGRFDAACRAGLAGEVGGRTLGAWSKDLMAIAVDGLSRWSPVDLPLLDPLRARVEAERSPGVDLLEAWRRDPSPAHVLAACAY